MRLLLFALPLVAVSAASSQTAVQLNESDPRDARVHAALARVYTDVRYDDVTLREALEHFRALIGVNMHVEWRAVDEYGVTPDDKVRMDLKRGSGRMILELLLEEASSERVVGYHVRDGVLVVSNSEARDRDMTVRTYSLRDLVAPRRDTLQVQDWESEEIRDRANQLASVIMDSIEPDEWRATGGGSGTAEWLDGILTVRARPDTHLQLKGLLAALRRVNPGGDTAMLPDRDAFSDESEKAHRALDEMLPTVRFYKTPLRDALRWIAMEYDAGMHVRWANIEECGVEPDRPVELRLDNVSVGETLRVLLREHSATFGIEEGVLLIGVGERSSPRTYVHLYAVGDITRGDAAKVGNLMFVITDTIEPDSWAVNGGLGSITCLNETLVVRNSGRVHADVRALLASIRKTRATSQTKEGPPAVALPTRRP